MKFTSYKKFYFHWLVNVEPKPYMKVLKNIFHNMTLKNLYVITILQSYFSNLEALIQMRLEGYYNNAFNVRISSDSYGSKMRKLSRCKPTVSNETIPATKHEFF